MKETKNAGGVFDGGLSGLIGCTMATMLILVASISVFKGDLRYWPETWPTWIAWMIPLLGLPACALCWYEWWRNGKEQSASRS